jgi:hypothetical protein
MKETKYKIVKNLINIRGWTTNRRLVVIESDDWGSIRMPSREVYEKLLKSGDKVDCDAFTKYDSLESESDLAFLFDIITRYKDCKGKYPVITANCAVANPDFDKIKASGYREFYYEPFTDTLKKFPEHKRSFDLWQEGIKQNIFFPQLHCREHMNVARWMKHLQRGISDVETAFSYGMISIGNSFTSSNRFAYMDAFNYDTMEELIALKTILKEGVELFKRIFGYPSKSFVATCYIWSPDFEKELANNDIEYIQGSHIQLIPRKTEGTTTLGKKQHYLGQVNRYNQIYLMRNCRFEPSWDHNLDWVDQCLWEIATAFKWNKPAAISTHRLNYIGYINEANRDKNLKLLSLLLAKIINIWPNVEFITSVELGEIMRRG